MDPQTPPTPDEQSDRQDRRDRVVVVTQDGMGVSPGQDDSGGPPNPAAQVEEPAKVMRIGSMIKQLLEEVRNAPLDEAGRTRLAQVHTRSITELEKALAPELVDELQRISLPFGDSETPSDAELRIAHAQLVGWLEGLFHGIQTALFAQQMASRAQLQQMKALPGGGPAPGETGPGLPGMPGAQGQPDEGSQRGGTGQYL